MIKNPIVLMATGLFLAVGAAVFSWQGGRSVPSVGSPAEDGSQSAGTHRPGSPSSAMSAHRRASNTHSVANLLEKLAACRDAGEGFDREAFSSLMGKLLQLDEEAAVGFVESFPAGHVRNEALRRFAQALVSRDPERAERWASNLPDEAERGSALGEVCSRIALADAADAVRKFESHRLDGSSGVLLENLVQQWADQDYSAAEAWTLGRPLGEQRDQMCGRLAIVLAATQPADAARLVLQEIPEGLIQTEAVVSVLHQWGIHDIYGASAWVALFPPGSLKERAETELSQVDRLR